MVNVAWVLRPSTFPTRKFIVGLVVVILFYIRIGIIQKWVIQTKTDPILCHTRGSIINLSLMMMVKVVLVLVPPNYPLRKFIFQRHAWWGFLYLSFIVQYSLWCHLGVVIIHLNIMTILRSVFLTVMVKAVLVLVTQTSNPVNLRHIWLEKSKSVFMVVLWIKKTNWI